MSAVDNSTASGDTGSGDSSFFAFSIGSKDGPSWPLVLGVLGAAGSLIIALIAGMFQHKRDRQVQEELFASQRRFEHFKADLEDRQRRLVRFENVQELMAQYKKPLLQSAFDLQSRLANQVKQGFLHIFCHQRNSKRDAQYARLNFCFVVAEFLGWLEVIRQEIVFIAGGAEDSAVLSGLVDAIKFAFTGETPVQGVPPRGQAGEPAYDLPQHANIMQLYAGELRAIGEVMLQEDSDAGSSLQALASGGGGGAPVVNQNLNVIGYAEFVRRMSKAGVPKGAGARLKNRWETQERFMQRSLAPLLAHVDALAALPKGEAPTKRLTLLQVLLCRLVELLDGAVAWDAGPAYDLEAGEEPRYIPRDFRLTPLVAQLSTPQREWLATQPFMASCDAYVDDPLGDWSARMEEEDPMWRKLCFCGFREDLASAASRAGQGGALGALGPQRARESAAGPDGWPGCFPPRITRRRPLHWYYERGLPPPVHIWVHTTQGEGGRDGDGDLDGDGKSASLTGKRRPDNRILILSPSIMAAEGESLMDAPGGARGLQKGGVGGGSVKQQQSRWSMLMLSAKSSNGAAPQPSHLPPMAPNAVLTRNPSGMTGMAGVVRAAMAANGAHTRVSFRPEAAGPRGTTEPGAAEPGSPNSSPHAQHMAHMRPGSAANMPPHLSRMSYMPPGVPAGAYAGAAPASAYGGAGGYGPDGPDQKKKRGMFASMVGALTGGGGGGGD